MWIDSHAHIDALSELEQEQVLARARDVGVRGIINASDSEESCKRVLEVVARHAEVYGNLGIHPHNAKDCDDQTLASIAKDLGRDKIIAIGEIGLDFHYDNSPREVQIAVFESFLELALTRKMPVVVHNRESSEQALASMKPYCKKGLRGMMHCYSDNWENAKRFLDMGLLLSFSGILTFRSAEGLREVASRAPTDRILIETDSPFLAPVPRRGKTNEPSYLPYTARCLAELRGVEPEELSRTIRRNCQDLFGFDLLSERMKEGA
jgi:TatD DNase family protein